MNSILPLITFVFLNWGKASYKETPSHKIGDWFYIKASLTLKVSSDIYFEVGHISNMSNCFFRIYKKSFFVVWKDTGIKNIAEVDREHLLEGFILDMMLSKSKNEQVCKYLSSRKNYLENYV